MAKRSDRLAQIDAMAARATLETSDDPTPPATPEAPKKPETRGVSPVPEGFEDLFGNPVAPVVDVAPAREELPSLGHVAPNLENEIAMLERAGMPSTFLKAWRASHPSIDPATIKPGDTNPDDFQQAYLQWLSVFAAWHSVEKRVEALSERIKKGEAFFKDQASLALAKARGRGKEAFETEQRKHLTWRRDLINLREEARATAASEALLKIDVDAWASALGRLGDYYLSHRPERQSWLLCVNCNRVMSPDDPCPCYTAAIEGKWQIVKEADDAK